MKRITLGSIILLSLIGGWAAIYATANGPWGYSDPVEYISTASSILHARGLGYYEGNGLFHMSSLHPPFYSLVLSGLGLSGINLVAAARWLNVCAFAATIFLAGWIIWKHSNAPAMGTAASLVLLLFTGMVNTFSSAYSEPLFIFMITAGGACLFSYLRKGTTTLLVASAAILGLASLTRNLGLAMIGAATVVVFFYAAGNKRERIKKTLLFAAISGLPMLLWFAYVYFTSSHSLAGRSLELNWDTVGAQFETFRGVTLDIIWKWIPFTKDKARLHYEIRLILVVAAAAATTGLTFLADRKLRKNGTAADGMTVFLFFSLSAVFTMAVLAITYLFIPPTIDIDQRMLLPFFVCLVMALAGAFSMWKEAWLRGKLRWMQALPWAAAAIWAYWYLPQSFERMKTYHQGEGLTAYFWNHSDVIEAVKQLPINVKVISNDWELLLLWTDRPIHGLWNTFPQGQETIYGSNQEDAAQALFCSQNTVLVLFKDFSTEYKAKVDGPLDNPEEALMGGLEVYGSYMDGTIYTCP